MTGSKRFQTMIYIAEFGNLGSKPPSEAMRRRAPEVPQALLLMTHTRPRSAAWYAAVRLIEVDIRCMCADDGFSRLAYVIDVTNGAEKSPGHVKLHADMHMMCFKFEVHLSDG